MTFFRLSIRRLLRQPHGGIALRLPTEQPTELTQTAPTNPPGPWDRDRPRSLSVNLSDLDHLHSLYALPASFDQLRAKLIGERDG